jgi:SAM-dependent methyltransferase
MADNIQGEGQPGRDDTTEAGPAPLAAVLRPRGRRRRREERQPDRSVAEARNRSHEPAEVSADFDAVLTDAFQVEEAAQLDPVAQRADLGPDRETLEEPERSLSGFENPSVDALPAGTDPLWAHRALREALDARTTQARPSSDGAWFSELFSREYLLGDPGRREFAQDPELDFVESSLDVATGGRVLDLACGYGRVALPLGRRGYEVIGIDLNLDMLERGLRMAQQDELSVKLVHGDMRDLKFSEVFDGACLLNTSFGFFDDIENLSVLRGLFRALKRGGRLVLGVINRDHLMAELPTRNWWEGDGCLLQEDIEYAHAEGRLKIRRYLVFGDGRERVYDISLRLFSMHEIRAMLELVGFEVAETSGSVHTRGAFFGPHSQQILLTAVRP